MIRSFRFRAPTNHPSSSINTNHSHRLIRFPARCSSPDHSHYTVLGLTPFASQAEVKRAFKRLALKYHPDVQKGQEKDFKEIVSAYECLMQKFENQEEEVEEITELDETDEWEEWMGFEAIAEGGNNRSLYKEADKYCRLISRGLSRGSGGFRLTPINTLVLAAVGATVGAVGASLVLY